MEAFQWYFLAILLKDYVELFKKKLGLCCFFFCILFVVSKKHIPVWKEAENYLRNINVTYKLNKQKLWKLIWNHQEG